MRNIDLKFPNSFINDNKGQGAVELILIIGGIIVIILLVVSMYKSYLVVNSLIILPKLIIE